MFCSNCGRENPDNAKFCASCGNLIADTPNQQHAPPPQPQYAPPPQPQYAPPPQPQYAPPFQPQNAPQPVRVQRSSGMATASLILGILGFSLFAVIFGGIALSQTGKDPNLSGRGMAVAGIILGVIGFIAETIWIINLVNAAQTAIISY
jgi:hypothetical protein